MRNKVFSAINIFGLAIGISTCLIIMLFVLNEFSYDRFNKKADRIVRVVFRGFVQGEKMREASVMPPTAQTLKADYPKCWMPPGYGITGGPVLLPERILLRTRISPM